MNMPTGIIINALSVLAGGIVGAFSVTAFQTSLKMKLT